MDAIIPALVAFALAGLLLKFRVWDGAVSIIVFFGAGHLVQNWNTNFLNNMSGTLIGALAFIITAAYLLTLITKKREKWTLAAAFFAPVFGLSVTNGFIATIYGLVFAWNPVSMLYGTMV